MFVAQQILKQLGGNKFIAMTGAKDLVAGQRHLTMRLGHFTGVRTTHVSVSLEPDDTYKMTFTRCRGTTVKTLAEHASVYAEDLCRVFEEQTGLRTRL